MFYHRVNRPDLTPRKTDVPSTERVQLRDNKKGPQQYLVIRIRGYTTNHISKTP